MLGSASRLERFCLTGSMFNLLIGSSEAGAPHSVTPTAEEKAGTPAIRRMPYLTLASRPPIAWKSLPECCRVSRFRQSGMETT